MAKKTKAKKTSFRQRLRNQSAERLDDILQAVFDTLACKTTNDEENTDSPDGNS